MSLDHVHRVLVVEAERLVGIVSSLDVMQWMARSAGYVVPCRSEP